jgi:heptaprenyl diphosphate synthase
MRGLFKEIKNELKVVEQELRNVFQTADPFVAEVATHLLDAGGKRLRPAFSLLAGRCADYNFERVLPLAVALELIHMATLVHDDVVDSSIKRRGVGTAKALWGNQISTQIGVYLFSRSLTLISGYPEPLIIKVLANASVRMCEGEILQVVTCSDPRQTIKDYFYRIKRKTALLIAASCQLGALVCGAPAGVYASLGRYGYNLGMAFQITDDILDMVADEELLGKSVGSDLHQGILTLPAIYALEHSPQKEHLSSLIFGRGQDEGQLQKAIELIEDCGGIAFAGQLAQKFTVRAKRALAILPAQPAKKALELVADFIQTRRF